MLVTSCKDNKNYFYHKTLSVKIFLYQPQRAIEHGAYRRQEHQWRHATKVDRNKIRHDIGKHILPNSTKRGNAAACQEQHNAQAYAHYLPDDIWACRLLRYALHHLFRESVVGYLLLMLVEELLQQYIIFIFHIHFVLKRLRVFVCL